MVGNGKTSVPYEATRWLPKAADLLQIICKLRLTYIMMMMTMIMMMMMSMMVILPRWTNAMACYASWGSTV